MSDRGLCHVHLCVMHCPPSPAEQCHGQVRSKMLALETLGKNNQEKTEWEDDWNYKGICCFWRNTFCHLIHKGKVSCREDNSLGLVKMLIGWNLLRGGRSWVWKTWVSNLVIWWGKTAFCVSKMSKFTLPLMISLQAGWQAGCWLMKGEPSGKDLCGRGYKNFVSLQSLT